MVSASRGSLRGSARGFCREGAARALLEARRACQRRDSTLCPTFGSTAPAHSGLAGACRRMPHQPEPPMNSQTTPFGNGGNVMTSKVSS